METYRWWLCASVLTVCAAIEGVGIVSAADPGSADQAVLRQQLEETQRLLRELQKNFETQSRHMKAQIDKLEHQLQEQGKLVDSLKRERTAPAEAVAQPKKRAAPSGPAAVAGGAKSPEAPAVAAGVKRPETPPVAGAAPPGAPAVATGALPSGAPTSVAAPETATAAAPLPVTAPAPAPAAGSATTTTEPWSPTSPIRVFGVGGAYMNISFDLLMDAGWSTEEDVPLIEPGDHDPKQRGFSIPNAEVVFDGAVDPYFTGFADVVWILDQNGETSVEFEEGYATTSSLPWNLQVKAGQQFVDFGRINLQHPHQWDFVDQPLIINRMFGPDGLRSAGALISWLAPTPFYSVLALSVVNSSGEAAFSFRNTDDEFFGRPPIDRPVSAPSDLLYVPRIEASFDLTDSQTIVTGLSGAFGPNDSGTNTTTQIYGGDLYWKWKPSWQSGGWPFLAWQTEFLGRRFEAGAAEVPGESDDAPPIFLPRQNYYDYGFYSQLIYGFTRRWAAGMRGEWLRGDFGPFPENRSTSDRIRVSPDITFYPSEFSKIRLQYNFDQGEEIGDQSSVWLQLEVLLGSHAAHKF